jgi:hypothetical protein
MSWFFCYRGDWPAVASVAANLQHYLRRPFAACQKFGDCFLSITCRCIPVNGAGVDGWLESWLKSGGWGSLKSAYLLDIVIVLPTLFWVQKPSCRCFFCPPDISNHQTTDNNKALIATKS